MVEVKIISGAYGYRASGRKAVKLIRANESVVVDEKEADRLVAIGVAQKVSTENEEKEAVKSVATPVEVLEDSSETDSASENKMASKQRTESQKKPRKKSTSKKMPKLTAEEPV